MYDNGVRPIACDNVPLLNYSSRLKKFTGKENVRWHAEERSDDIAMALFMTCYYSYVKYLHSFSVVAIPPNPNHLQLLLNVHYRHVNQATWNTFERYYSKSGPTIKCALSAVEDTASWTVVNARAAKQMYKDSLLASKKAAKKQSRWEKKMNKLGSFSKSNTLKASYLDTGGCLFNVDAGDILELVLNLSDALGGGEEGEGGGDRVLCKNWTEAYVKFALGVDLCFPDSVNNGELLQEEDR